MADIYIDGDKIGQTPMLVSNLLIGEHKIRFSKEGYIDNYKDIFVNEGETTRLEVALEKSSPNVIPTQSKKTNENSTSKNVISSWEKINLTTNSADIVGKSKVGDVTCRYYISSSSYENERRLKDCLNMIRKSALRIGGCIVLLGKAESVSNGIAIRIPATAYK